MSGDEVRPVALVPLLCSIEPGWVRCVEEPNGDFKPHPRAKDRLSGTRAG